MSNFWRTLSRVAGGWAGLELHPDKGGSADDFKRLQDAYEILSDTQLRSLYDRGGMKLVESFRDGGAKGEARLQSLMF